MEKSNILTVISPLLMACLSLCSPIATSNIVTQNLMGSINIVDPTYEPWVSVGDQFTVTLTYDDVLVSGTNFSFVTLDSQPEFDITITLNGVIYTKTLDEDYGNGYPLLTVLDGDLYAIDYYGYDFFGDYFVSIGAVTGFDFVISDASFGTNYVTGSLQTPLPSSAWLFISCIASIGIIGRVRKITVGR
ncbi:MAG: hypothetical protein V3T17_04270 [Pseudomonadales bacterium]